MTVKTSQPSPVFQRVFVIVCFALGLGAGVYWIVGIPKFLSKSSQQAPVPTPRQTATIPSGQQVIGYIDMTSGRPVISAVQGKDVEISGWAACAAPDSPLAKVEILVDGQPMASAVANAPRPDVAQAFARADFTNSGWKSTFPSNAIKPGTRELSARATCAKGESGDLPPFQLVVSASSNTTPVGR